MIGRLKAAVKRAVARRLLRANRAALQSSGLLHADRLPANLWDCSVGETGEMIAGGVALHELAREFGTPLHVVHIEKLQRNYDEFLGAFSGAHARVRLGTSYKTNPVPMVLRVLHERGSLAEVISHFELWLALELGVPGSRIIFNGPGKPREALELAVSSGVWLINVDSHEELEDLEAVCARRGCRQKIGLRVTTSVGWESQFGFGIVNGSALRGFRRAAESGHLDPVGIHLHLGTGISNVDTYVRGVSETLEFAAGLKAEIGVAPSVLDLGGGFGVPTTRSRTPWDDRLQHLGMPIRTAVPSEVPTPADYARRIVPLVNEYLEQTGAAEAELIFEPGRAISASAQMLLLSVVRVKHADREAPDVILDGGRNLCMPLAWEFHEVHPTGRMLETALETQNLYGPLCHPYDVVALSKPLPPLSVGDVVAVMDAGAYFVPNQMNFSNPRPGVVGVENGSARWFRTPESFADIVRLDAHESLAGVGA